MSLMNFKAGLLVMVICFRGLAPAQHVTGSDVIRSVHKKYTGAPCQYYTFSQKNKHFRNDSVVRTSEWHEAVGFPDKFRISFGSVADGNFVVFKNDSAFHYKKGALVKKRTDSNTVLLVLGGMFYRSIEDVMTRLKSAGYDLDKLSSRTWKNGEVYVVGAALNDSLSNQLWVNKKTLRVERILEKTGEPGIMDMRFEAHRDWCKGYMETKVSFRRNGKLEQEEEYFDIRKEDGFRERATY